MKWYEPNTLWEITDVEDRNDFVIKHVVVAKFHSLVPEDINNAFETVSYLLASAYFHIPMFDEAMNKALIILEMAVKLKAKELNIPLKNPPKKNNFISSRRLNDITNDVLSKTNLNDLKPQFDRARDIRNNKLHLDSHQFAGFASAATDNCTLIINLINELFLPQKVILKTANTRVEIQKELEVFKDDLFILEYDNTRILVDEVYEFKYTESVTQNVLVLFVNPVLNSTYDIIMNNTYGKPLLLKLKNFEFNNEGLLATDLNGGIVKLTKNKKKENRDVYHKHIDDLKRVDEKHMFLYSNHNATNALWSMEQIVYENCWSE